MKFAILSLAAAGALTLSAGSASAQPGHYHGGGYNRSYHPPVPHLDYHRGHYHYHDGFYRSGPLYPVYPSYSYPSYNSGYSFGVTRPGLSITIGSGSVYPSYGYGGGFYNQPYYGGYGRRW